MSHSNAISDADWARIAHRLPCAPGKHGPVSGDNLALVTRVSRGWRFRAGRFVSFRSPRA